MITGFHLGGARPINRRIIIEGQSNAMGVGERVEITQSPLTSDPGLATFDTGTFARVYIQDPATGNYAKLQNGVNNYSNTSTRIGPEFGIAVRWMRETSQGLLFIDKAHGNGMPISYFQQGDSRGFYNTTVSNRANSNAWLAANGIRVAEMGMLWVQGESGESAGYATALTTMIANKIAAHLLPSNAKIVIAKQYPSSAGYDATVRAGQDTFIAANPSTATGIVYPAYFNSDNLHLNARGQIQLGYDAFSVLFARSSLSA